MKDNSSELFPIVDPTGTVIGSATRGECHNGSHLLHPVVHLHVFDPSGALYLQRRPQWKDIQPGKWDTAVGGHVDYGECVSDALRREALEELGLADFMPVGVATYVFDGLRESELVNVFACVCQPDAVSPSDELDGGRFWHIAEIVENLGKNVFTPNFEDEFRKLDLENLFEKVNKCENHNKKS